jgi:iron-sulfur cluster repair protein YtfE (RIC family)
MLNKEELKELVFFADKVATVHWPDHQEFIRVNEIVKDIENKNLDNSDYEELIKLTNWFIVPEWACKAQTRLLNLLEKGIN